MSIRDGGTLLGGAPSCGRCSVKANLFLRTPSPHLLDSHEPRVEPDCIKVSLGRAPYHTRRLRSTMPPLSFQHLRDVRLGKEKEEGSKPDHETFWYLTGTGNLRSLLHIVKGATAQ